MDKGKKIAQDGRAISSEQLRWLACNYTSGCRPPRVSMLSAKKARLGFCRKWRWEVREGVGCSCPIRVASIFRGLIVLVGFRHLLGFVFFGGKSRREHGSPVERLEASGQYSIDRSVLLSFATFPFVGGFLRPRGSGWNIYMGNPRACKPNPDHLKYRGLGVCPQKAKSKNGRGPEAPYDRPVAQSVAPLMRRHSCYCLLPTERAEEALHSILFVHQ